MAALPNLNGRLRVVYLVIGIALGAWGLYWVDATWARITLLAAGSLVIVFGLIGFCPILWLFGVKGSPPE